MIDPKVLEAQKAPHRVERKCSQCGRRTTDQTGRCSRCRRAGIVSLNTYSLEQLVGLSRAIRDEIQRRRDEAGTALEMASASAPM